MNVGVRLGGISRVADKGYLAVIDCDVKGKEARHEKEMLAALAKAWPELAALPHPIVLSGRGGGSAHHYILTKTPARPRHLVKSKERVEVYMPGTRPSERDKKALGLEKTEAGIRSRPAWEISIMGEGQQVVLPPSIHPDSGMPYEWADIVEPGASDFHVFEVPEHFEGTEKDVAERGFRFTPVNVDLGLLAGVDREMIEKGAGVEDRSTSLFHAACAMVRVGYTDEQIASALTDQRNFLGQVPYDHAKTMDLIRAGDWLYRYTIDPARKGNDASIEFDRALEVSRELSPEEQIMQALEMETGDWRDKLDRTDIRSGGKTKPTMKNVVIILENAVGSEVFRHNAFKGVDLHGCATPWGGRRDSVVRDVDVSNIKLWLATHYGFEPKTQQVEEAIAIIARRNEFHPIRDHLKTLKWDGKERVDFWLRDFASADGPDKYLRAISRKTLVALVARALRPGVKYDQVLILEGYQGARKSTLLKTLAGGDEYFTDQEINVRDKDAVMTIQGKWITELGELATMRRSDQDSLKSFISRTHDRMRLPYGRRTEEFPRQGIMIGSTNLEEYLKDDSGHRRFWPVVVGACNPEGLAACRDQLLAEAVFLFEMGEPLYLEDAEVQSLARQVQAEKEPADALGEEVGDWIAAQLKLDEKDRTEKLDDVRISDVMKWPPFVAAPTSLLDPRKMGVILRNHGYHKVVERESGRRHKIWKRKV